MRTVCMPTHTQLDIQHYQTTKTTQYHTWVAGVKLTLLAALDADLAQQHGHEQTNVPSQQVQPEMERQQV